MKASLSPRLLCFCQKMFRTPCSLYLHTQWTNKLTCELTDFSFFLVLPFLCKLCSGNCHISFRVESASRELGVFCQSVRKHLFGCIDLPRRSNLLIDLSRAAADVKVCVFLTMKHPDTTQRKTRSGKACWCIMEACPLA